jgi:ParB family chromosome partitioning protein
MAGKATVPTIVLENISDEEAMVYVVETNLMQRSFTDMSHSEKAAVIAMHHSKMFSQGKRNDILEQLKALENSEAAENPMQATAKEPTSPHDGTELESGVDESSTGKRTKKKIGEMYSLSRNTIARYLRVSQLNTPLKMMLDNGRFTFLVAVELSFLNKEEQEWLVEFLEDGFSVNTAKAAALREYSKESMLDSVSMNEILAGQTATESKPRRVKISGEFYGRYFNPEQSAKEVEGIVEEALTLYFENRRGLAE